MHIYPLDASLTLAEAAPKWLDMRLGTARQQTDALSVPCLPALCISA